MEINIKLKSYIYILNLCQYLYKRNSAEFSPKSDNGFCICFQGLINDKNIFISKYFIFYVHNNNLLDLIYHAALILIMIFFTTKIM